MSIRDHKANCEGSNFFLPASNFARYSSLYWGIAAYIQHIECTGDYQSNLDWILHYGVEMLFCSGSNVRVLLLFSPWWWQAERQASILSILLSMFLWVNIPRTTIVALDNWIVDTYSESRSKIKVIVVSMMNEFETLKNLCDLWALLINLSSWKEQSVQ